LAGGVLKSSDAGVRQLKDLRGFAAVAESRRRRGACQKHPRNAMVLRTTTNGATHAMADYQSIIYEKVEDKIFRITLNRPEKINALSPQLLAELDQATEAFDDDPEASVLII